MHTSLFAQPPGEHGSGGPLLLTGATGAHGHEPLLVGAMKTRGHKAIRTAARGAHGTPPPSLGATEHADTSPPHSR